MLIIVPLIKPYATYIQFAYPKLARIKFHFLISAVNAEKSEFSFKNIHDSLNSKGRGGYFFAYSLPLPLASQTLRH